jgi:hypothetical protein
VKQRPQGERRIPRLTEPSDHLPRVLVGYFAMTLTYDTAHAMIGQRVNGDAALRGGLARILNRTLYDE